MNNKNPPLSIFKATSKIVIPAKTGSQKILLYLVFQSLLILIIPFITNAQLITPKISITSLPESAGIAVNIRGTGFSAGSTATLYMKKPDGSQLEILSMGISHDGSFNISHLFPPGYPTGSYLFWVVDGPTGRQSNRVNFNMTVTQSNEIRMPTTPSLPQTSSSYAPQHGDLFRAKGEAQVYLIQGQQYRDNPSGFNDALLETSKSSIKWGLNGVMLKRLVIRI